MICQQCFVLKDMKLEQFQLVEGVSMSPGHDIQVDEFTQDWFPLWYDKVISRTRCCVSSVYEHHQENAASSSAGSRSSFGYFLFYARSDPGVRLRASMRSSSQFPYTLQELPRLGERGGDHPAVC